MKVWKIIAVIGIIFFLMFGALYVYSLSKVKLISTSIAGVEDINLRGFTLNGNVEVYNGGLIPVSIDRVEYKVTSERSGNILATGKISGKMVAPKQAVAFTVSTTISWKSVAEVAINKITKKGTGVKVTGDIYISTLKLINFKIHFQQNVNV